MKSREDDIEGFLRRPNTCFKIPDFQRQYSWHRGNCEVFLTDFEEALISDKNHYMGNVFYQPISRDESVLIDGQQRITTILLMLIAIYHLLQDDPGLSENKDLTERLRREFLENEYLQEDNRVKLKTMTDDEKIFKRIYARKVQEEDKTSNLYKTYSYFRDRFAERFKVGEIEPQQYIDGLRRLKIIAIELEEKEDDLQKIFEGINSTGVELSEGDKIRNFALMLNDDGIRDKVTEEYWKRVEQELVDTKKGANYIADFFRKFLIIHLKQDIKEKEVYAKFKAFFKEKVKDQSDETQVMSFYEMVIDDLERYVLLKFNRQWGSRPYADLSKEAYRINSLGVEVTYPLLMCALRDYKNRRISLDEAREFFKVTESYLIRRVLADIATMGLNKSLNALYSDIVAISEENDNVPYIDIYKYILCNRRGTARFPSTQYIRERFIDSDVGNKRVYRYFILSSWDDHRQPKESFLLQQMNSGDSKYSLEHIMPQKLTPEWKRGLGSGHAEIHERYLNCLANLTLTGYNSEYSNKSFTEKLNHEHGYANSNLLINDFIKQQTCWNEDVLKQRIEWWLEAIDAMWPVPETDFQPKVKGATSLSLASAPDNLQHSKPISITLQDEGQRKVNHWHELIDYFLDTMYLLDEKLPEKLANDPRTTKWVSAHPEDFYSSVEIDETGYFVSTTNDTNSKISFMKNVSELIGVPEEDILLEIFFK